MFLRTKKVLALILIITMGFNLLPDAALSVKAETSSSGEYSDFTVTTYDITARIELPHIEEALSYQVYLSTEDSLDVGTATKVYDSTDYSKYVYADNLLAGTLYYFYFLTDNDINTVANISATTQTGKVYWTDEGNYDGAWYNFVIMNYENYNTENPLLISSEMELATFSRLVNNGYGFQGKSVELTTSLDMSEYLWIPIGSAPYYFFGSFDGNGQMITGLHTNVETNEGTANNQGLFGALLGVSIQNVKVADSCIKGYGNVGGIAGFAQDSVINNCYNSGMVQGSEYTGGIIGATFNTIMTTNQNGGVVYGKNYVGGVSGMTDYISTISGNCNTAKVSGTGNFVGGVVGKAAADTASNYNTGNISGDYGVGGVIGKATKDTKDSYNTGTVSGNQLIGGCVGSTEASLAGNHNEGGVSGESKIGGIAGELYNYSNMITATYNYNTGEISGHDSVGGIAGYSSRGKIEKCYNTGTIHDMKQDSNASLYLAGIVGNAFNSDISNNYNTGIVDGTNSTDKADYVGGIVGYVRESSLINNYNTGSVTASAYVGGILGSSYANITINKNFNTASISGTAKVGGIAGNLYQGVTISNCYNIGIVTAINCFVGGVVGENSGAAISNCYYSGYSGGVGQGTSTQAFDSGTTPFISYQNPLGTVRYTKMIELTMEDLPSEFTDAFGITNLIYPDEYEVSDISIATMVGNYIYANKTNTGQVNISGKTSSSSGNGNIKIIQNALNMEESGVGFAGAGAETIESVYSTPLTIDTSVNGIIPVSISPSISETIIVHHVTVCSELSREDEILSGKEVLFALYDSASNKITLESEVATTDANNMASIDSWIPTEIGTYTLMVSYEAEDGLKTGSLYFEVLKESPSVTVEITPKTSAIFGTVLKITPSIQGVYGTSALPEDFEYYIDGNKYTSNSDSYSFLPESAKPYAIYVKYRGNNHNYEATSITTDYTVGKITPDMELKESSAGNIYNGNEITGNTATIKGVNGMAEPSGTISYTYYIDSLGAAKTTKENSGAISEGGAPVFAGTYYVKASYSGDNNYNAVSSPFLPLIIDLAELRIEGLTVTDRVYNGTTEVELTGGTLTGIITGDDITADIPTRGTVDKNIGVDKSVSIPDVSFSGERADNYKLTLPTIKVDIKAATLDITVMPRDKVYDGDKAATVEWITYHNKVENDDVILSGGTVTFADKNGGNDIEVIAEGFSLSGTDAGNYILGSIVVTPANITKRAITITPIANWKYFGQGDEEIIYEYSGNISEEIPVFTGELSREEGEDTGAYVIVKGDLSLSDSGIFSSSNYTLAISSTAVYYDILEYNPTQIKASANATGKNNWFIGDFSLIAPEGYEISESNSFTQNMWTEEITIECLEGKDSSLDYYLREVATGAISVKKTFIYQADETKPIVTYVSGNPTDWVMSEQPIAFTVLDSNLDTVSFYKGDEPETHLSSNDDTYHFITSGNGIYTMTAMDKAGNTTTKEIEVNKIDTNTNFSVNISGNTSTPCDSDKTTIDITEIGDSGVTKVEIKFNNEDYVDITSTYTNGYVVKANGDYQCRVTNGVGIVKNSEIIAYKNINKKPMNLGLEDSVTGNEYNGKEIIGNTATRNIDDKVTDPTGEIAYTYYLDKAGTSVTTAQNSGTARNGGAPVYAGTYYVKASYAGDTNYFAEESDPAMLMITPKVLTVTPHALSKYVGQSDPVLTYSYNGVITNETPLFSGKLSRAVGESQGNYKIGIGTLTLLNNNTFRASNYIIALNSIPISFELKKTATDSDNELLSILGKKVTKGSVIYKVTKSDKTHKTISVEGVKSKKITTVNIVGTIKINGYTFKVTSIKKSAFKNCKKLKKVTIGSNITSIGTGAFYGNSKLKSITIKSKKITQMGKNMLTKIYAKAAIKVPKSKFKDYNKQLKKAGLGKKMMIKK